VGRDIIGFLMQGGSIKRIYGPLAISVIGLAFALFMAVSYSGPSIAPAVDLKESQGEAAPEFTLEDLSGKQVSLSDFKNTRRVVINFWASWCVFCLQELPDLAELQKKFSDSIVVLAVNRGESISEARKYISQQNLEGRLIFLTDPEDKIFKQYQGYAMPTSVFISRSGVILLKRPGQMSLSEMQKVLESFLY